MQTPIASTAAMLLMAAVAPALAQEGAEAKPSSAATFDASMAAMPSYGQPAVAWRTYDDARSEETICRDRIYRAREESGQPPLDREPATGDEPLAIWAVDRREDGCSVLVAKGDPDDIRPIPKIEDGPMLRPAG